MGTEFERVQGGPSTPAFSRVQGGVVPLTRTQGGPSTPELMRVQNSPARPESGGLVREQGGSNIITPNQANSTDSRTRALSSDVGVAKGNNRINSSGAALPTIKSRTSLTYKNIVPAGGTLPIPAAGTFFYVQVATAPVKIRPSDGVFVEYEQGTGLNLDLVNSFSQLEVRNDNAAAVVVVIFVGFDGFIDNRLILQNGLLQSAVYPTYPVASAAVSIAITDRSGTQFTDSNGLNWYAIARQSILIFNTDTGVTLLLQKSMAAVAADPSIAAIYPQTSLNYPAAGNWKIIQAAPVNAIVSETYLAVLAP